MAATSLHKDFSLGVNEWHDSGRQPAISLRIGSFAIGAADEVDHYFLRDVWMGIASANDEFD